MNKEEIPVYWTLDFVSVPRRNGGYEERSYYKLLILEPGKHIIEDVDLFRPQSEWICEEYIEQHYGGCLTEQLGTNAFKELLAQRQPEPDPIYWTTKFIDVSHRGCYYEILILLPGKTTIEEDIPSYDQTGICKEFIEKRYGDQAMRLSPAKFQKELASRQIHTDEGSTIVPSHVKTLKEKKGQQPYENNM